jgi:GDP/UDP-N,N'-diacetylbacillosamine 2-epimerase (hydrolysing)
MNARIPIAHLHGGEITEGLIDEAIRHSITKMSYLHFTSTEEYARRVIQLGEHPDRVFNVGAIGIEAIHEMNFMNRKEFEQSINLKINKKLALLTFHPVTLENDTAGEQFDNILQALDEFDELQIIITKANADAGGSIVNRMIDEYADKNKEKCRAFYSLGQERYYNAMKYCDFIIGNSSSGIIEAPSFQKPTINIGDRQKGRVQAKSVINCRPVKSDIVSAVRKALSKEFLDTLSGMDNPYGDGNVSEKVVSVIREHLKQGISLKKQFYDL